MKRCLIALTLIFSFSCAHPKPQFLPTNINLVEKALLSVGHITGKFEEDGELHQYGCTAFSIDIRKWMTAAHCVGLDMLIDGHPASLVAENKEQDLAVLVADYVKPALQFRTAPLVRQEEVVALGYGYSWKYPTITHHFVIMLNYSPYAEIWPGVWYSTGFIGGMSGGPVLDLTGQIVGIVQRGDSQVGYGVDGATMVKFLN